MSRLKKKKKEWDQGKGQQQEAKGLNKQGAKVVEQSTE